MDTFKTHIQQQRSFMDDVDEPDSDLWQKIESKLPKETSVKKMFPVWTKYAVAACIIGLAAFGAVLFNKKEISVVHTIKPIIKSEIPQIPKTVIPAIKENEILAVTPTKKEDVAVTKNSETKNKNHSISENNIAKTESAVKNMEAGFYQIINLQKNKINTTPLYGEGRGYYNDFINRLKQIDNDEISLKKDIHVQGLNDALLEQLINIYQQKLNLLKSLQSEMNKTNNQYKKNHTPIEKTQTNFLNI